MRPSSARVLKQFAFPSRAPPTNCAAAQPARVTPWAPTDTKREEKRVRRGGLTGGALCRLADMRQKSAAEVASLNDYKIAKRTDFHE